MEASPPTPDPTAAGLLGYLNFSDGRPDARWQRQLNERFAALAGPETVPAHQRLRDWLVGQLDLLAGGDSSAFRDVTQARAVIELVFDRLLPAYRAWHADLLAHQPDAALFTPFFLARACEAVLAQGPPWGEADRIIGGALRRLNDFVGHRPIAVLESRPQTELYDHERVRPVPLYLRGAGVGAGPYRAVVEKGLDLLARTDPDVLADAHFDPTRLDELSFDPRAFDHNHPVNRRPNYAFGEWDPHQIDNRGQYRRYVIRQCTLDAMCARVPPPGDTPESRREYEEKLFEAGAVLAGTVLMGAGVSGYGPGAHDSTATLATMVPRIARYRDAFYEWLIANVAGPHGERLRAEMKVTRQPFGGARQHLNAALSRQRAEQLQERRLALVYAEMGYPQASRERAARIQTPSVRMLAEVRLRQTAARLALRRGDRPAALALLPEVEDLLRRGIACGALADPWNVLGFQGLFPLFQAREDAVRDPRVEELLDVVGRQFDLYAEALAARAAAGESQESAAAGLRAFADWWDRFATADVSDLPRVHGGERADAAEHVASALSRLRERGEAGGGVTFWRQHLEGFRTPAAFAQVLEALLKQPDRRPALALLMTWLSEADAVPLEEGTASFAALARRWLTSVLADRQTDKGAADELIGRFFELLEVNADHYWQVPEVGPPTTSDEAGEDVFGAAYDDVTWKDSADDGQEGALLGDGPAAGDFTLEEEAPRLENRLRFLEAVARLWQQAAAAWLADPPANATPAAAWLRQARADAAGLEEMLDRLAALRVPEPLGAVDAVVEYERRRGLKDQLLDTGINACVEFRLAERALACVAGGEDADVELERAVGRGDREAARATLPPYLARFRREPLLYVPLSDGGQPRQILRARLAKTRVQFLLERLPRLGLLREAWQALKLARTMEQNAPPEGRKVTEFDRLFARALPPLVRAVLDAVDADPPTRRPTTALAPVPPAQRTELLRRLVDSLLSLWISHSQSLRLSSLEAVSRPEDWQALVEFVRRYGRELFTPAFLNLANLRGILHRGVGAWLESAAEQGEGPARLLADLDSGALARERAIRHLEVVLQAIAENYEEYRDYNATTTQSDYGENLHLLLDVLRVKAGYDRYAWRIRPLVQAHEVLCRRHRPEASRWYENVGDITRKLGEQLLADLGRLEIEHGLRLRTVRDRLEERFLQPLVIDRLLAEVGPAVREAYETNGEPGPAFGRLREQVDALAATPAGVGLDVPAWLRRLEAELERVRSAEAEGAPLDAAEGPAGPPLSLAELAAQFAEWDRPADEQG